MVTADPGPAVPGGARRWIIAVTTMMASTVVILDVVIVNVALDHMRGSLSAAVDEVTWVLTSFLVANAISLPITGWLTDLLGRKRLFILGIGAFTVTSAAAGAAPNLASLVAARFLQGLAGGPLVPLSQAIMLETFPGRQRGMAMALWGMGIMFAPIVGPTLGGWITDHWSWRWIFYIAIPMGALTTLMTVLVIPEPLAARPAVTRIDIWGLCLLVTGIAGLQFVLDRGQREDWFASPLIVRVGLVAVIALVLLVLHELRTRDPVIDLRVLRHRTFAAATLAMLVMSVAFYGVIVVTALFTQMLMGYSAWHAGLVLASGGVSTLVIMPLAGALLARIDSRWVIATGSALSAYAMYLMATLTLEASFWQVMWPRVVQGFGIGLTFVPLSTTALSAVPLRELGHASGLFNFIRTIGGAAGIAGMATWLERGSQAHQAHLIGHVSLYDSEVWHRYHALVTQFVGRGSDPATAELQAWAFLYDQVRTQALFLAFLDDFWRLGWIFAAVIPLLLLFERPRPTVTVPDPAAAGAHR